MPKTPRCPCTHRGVSAKRQRLVRYAQDPVVPTHAPRVRAKRQQLVRHDQDPIPRPRDTRLRARRGGTLEANLPLRKRGHRDRAPLAAACGAVCKCFSSVELGTVLCKCFSPASVGTVFELL